MSSRRLLAGDPECDRGAALGAPLPVGATGRGGDVSGPQSWSPTSGFTARTAPPIRGFTEWVRGVRNSLQGCYRPRPSVQIVSGRGVLASLRSGAFLLSPELKANCFCIHSSPPSSFCACAFQSGALPCQQAGPEHLFAGPMTEPGRLGVWINPGPPFTLPLALGLNCRDFSPEDGFLGMLSQLGDSLPSLLQPCLSLFVMVRPPSSGPLCIERLGKPSRVSLRCQCLPRARAWESGRSRHRWKEKDNVSVLLFPREPVFWPHPGPWHCLPDAVCALWSCPPSLGEELLKLSHWWPGSPPLHPHLIFKSNPLPFLCLL